MKASSLEYPLLRVAHELYPNHPTERDLVLGFLENRLRELRVKSESECPANELELVDWIAQALDYGRREGHKPGGGTGLP